jgi:hypothetical protein
MKNVFTIVFTLIVALASGSCQMQFGRKTVVPAASSSTVVSAASFSVADSGTLTLSGDQLVFLDWDGRTASRAKVIRKRVVGNSAVDFDIHFPSNRPGNCTLNYVSGGSGGLGKLIGLDISSFETFALKFTFISIEGVAGSEATQELAVGVLIGPTKAGKLSDIAPVTLGGRSGRITAVSSIPIAVGRIWQIGFHAHMVNPKQWRRSGSTVRIRVEPVEDATIRPWP